MSLKRVLECILILLYLSLRSIGASLVAQMVKNLPAMQEIQVQSLGQEDLMEKGMATHSSILAGESRGQRSLEGYSPWGHKKLDRTERLTNTHCSMGLKPLDNQS